MSNKLYATESLRIISSNSMPINDRFKILEPFDTVEDYKDYPLEDHFISNKFELTYFDANKKIIVFNNFGFDNANEAITNHNKFFLDHRSIESYLINKFKYYEQWNNINHKRVRLKDRLTLQILN